jgi:hypothetical protein
MTEAKRREEDRAKIDKVINDALASDGYLITVSRRVGDKLYHWQIHNFEFYYLDLLPSLDEIKKLIMERYRHLGTPS